MYRSLVLVTALAAEIGSATVGLSWSFPDAEQPQNGLNDVTFPFDLSKAPHEDGFYFAQQFFFNGVESGAYTGLQPRPDNSSGSVIHAVFSSFIKGTTFNSSLCYAGADGGDGVSCAVQFTGDYSHEYDCVVETTDEGSTWRGTVVDAVSGESHAMGEWTLPKKAAGIQTQGAGFVEYYIYPRDSAGNEICDALPLTEISFFSPSSNTSGANEGTLGQPYEYGVCEGKSAFSTQQITDGYCVKTGFQI
ncbi:hypothetical protein LMH87_011494 [Akanthomyces muscarius]|uniref:Uncharacterized protein n=1 Tax=Akanthomyces muscarius TaxID=2231603 RepID=A0A9W8QA17_AKAMU|nr:hypothetical protein LMH87_011494 [Akanthomyces muscarius]KAJ4150759.1 hypothetical protein LMH87_011494 [Akanthomyces muscarius]